MKWFKPSPAVSHLSACPEPMLPHLLPSALDSAMQLREEGRVTRYNWQADTTTKLQLAKDHAEFQTYRRGGSESHEYILFYHSH